MDVLTEEQTKPLCASSAFSYIPPRRSDSVEMSYFQRKSKLHKVFTYDQVFHQAEGYDMKLRRDDRTQGRGLDIYGEEKLRTVPLRSSAVYGHLPAHSLFQPTQQYKRVACTKAEFFMKNGIIWNVAEGYGSVAPCESPHPIKGFHP